MNARARLHPLRAVSARSSSRPRLPQCQPRLTPTTMERVVSPKGITAWLVREPSVPLIAIEFAFRGGATQDPVDKPGVADC